MKTAQGWRFARPENNIDVPQSAPAKEDTMAWRTSADISFMDPNAAVNVVYRVRQEDEPDARTGHGQS